MHRAITTAFLDSDTVPVKAVWSFVFWASYHGESNAAASPAPTRRASSTVNKRAVAGAARRQRPEKTSADRGFAPQDPLSCATRARRGNGRKVGTRYV